MGCIQFLAVLMHRIKQPVEAQALFERSLQISKEIDLTIGTNHHDIAFLYIWYSNFLMDIHQLDRASELLRQALVLFELGTDPFIVARDRAFAQIKLAYVLMYAGKIDEAETIFRDALETKTEDVNELNCLTSLGDIFRLTSRPLEAVQTFQSSLELIQKISEREKGVRQVQPTSYLRHYALSLKLVDRYSEAEGHYKDALKTSRISVSESPEVYLPGLSMVLNDFAILCYEMSQYSKARKLYDEAFALTLNNYSILLREMNDDDKALKFYYKALGIGRELAQKFPENIFHSHLLGTVLNNLGVFHRKRGEKDKAEDALREALEVRKALAEKTPDIYLNSIATTINNLGVALAAAGKLSEAKKVSQQGLEVRRELVKKSPEMHNRRLGLVLNNLGNMYKLSDEHSKAEKCYQEALDILENLVADAPSVYQRYIVIILSNLLLYHSQQKETGEANSIRKRLEEIGICDLPQQEVWIEEEDTEANSF
jgi:tetratricopeptide (TPR) repeat protein